MNTNVGTLLPLVLLTALPLLAADVSPKDEVITAAKKLAEQPNYSWNTTVVVPATAQFKPGPSDGKTEKEGFTHVTMSFGDNHAEVVLKGDRAVVAGQDSEWKLTSELEDSQGPGRFLARMARNLKTPGLQAIDLVAAVKELKKDGGVYSGEMTEEGAKKQFRFGQPKDAKGSVKFWVKDGVLTKLETKVQGKVEINGNEVDADRATTTEIQAVGTTKLNVPEAAKKKLT